MKNTVTILRESLFSIIRRLVEEPERYARKPGRDFTRKRTLTPAVLIQLIVTMDEKSIWKGLLGHFRRRIDTPSASAFVQQRQKLLPSALEDLFHRFSDHLRPQKKFRGYRLLAADGSSLKSGAYPADKDAYRSGTERQHGWNLFHINALFDLENGIYTDVIVQKEHTKHESRALREMAVRSAITDPVIVLADRNYEAYNNFACLEKRGWKYLIRIKDHERKNAYGLKLPDEPEFDLPIRMTLGRLTPQQLRQQGIPVPEHYYRLPNSIPFDFLGTESTDFYPFSSSVRFLSKTDRNPCFLGTESTDFYPFSTRIVRLTLKDGRTQLLITNLDAEQFPLSALRELYAQRWGIETSFRELKYTVGLIHLHSRKSDLVLQEIFAAFTVFNFTQAVAWSADEGCGHSKYKRRVNFAHAVYLCCEALRGKSAEITGLLERTLTPRRPDRFYPRPKITGNRLSAMYVSAR